MPVSGEHATADVVAIIVLVVVVLAAVGIIIWLATSNNSLKTKANNSIPNAMPNNQTDLGSAVTTAPNVYYQNGTLATSQGVCLAEDQRVWTQLNGCVCKDSFFGAKCEQETHDSRFIDMGLANLSDGSIVIPKTTQVVVTPASFLSFNSGALPSRNATVSCTDQCLANPECVGVLFNNQYLSTVTPPTAPDVENTCTMFLGPMQIVSAPPYSPSGVNSAGVNNNLFMMADSYPFNMVFNNQVFLSGDSKGFTVRYWLATPSTFPLQAQLQVQNYNSYGPTIFKTVAFNSLNFIADGVIGVYFRNATVYNTNKNVTLQQLFTMLSAQGIVALVAQGIYIHLPWIANYNLISAWGSSSAPMYVAYTTIPPYSPQPP